MPSGMYRGSLPPTIAPSGLEPGKEYFIAVRCMGMPASIEIIGPFTLIRKLRALEGNLPTAGHFLLQVHMHDKKGRSAQRVVAPKDGHNVIFGQRYTLHPHASEYLTYFSAEHAVLRKLLSTETASFC